MYTCCQYRPSVGQVRSCLVVGLNTDGQDMWPDYTITGGPSGQQSGHLASKKGKEEDQEQDGGTTSNTTRVSPGSG